MAFVNDALVSTRWRIAISEFLSGDFDMALDLFQQINSPSSQLSFNVGVAYLKLHMYPLAIIEFEKALDSSDLDLFTDYALGIACRYEGDSYQALDHFKKSLQMTICYCAINDEDSALEVLIKARQLPSSAAHEDLISRAQLEDLESFNFLQIPNTAVIPIGDIQSMTKTQLKPLRCTPLLDKQRPASIVRSPAVDLKSPEPNSDSPPATPMESFSNNVWGASDHDTDVEDDDLISPNPFQFGATLSPEPSPVPAPDVKDTFEPNAMFDLDEFNFDINLPSPANVPQRLSVSSQNSSQSVPKRLSVSSNSSRSRAPQKLTDTPIEMETIVEDQILTDSIRRPSDTSEKSQKTGGSRNSFRRPSDASDSSQKTAASFRIGSIVIPQRKESLSSAFALKKEKSIPSKPPPAKESNKSRLSLGGFSDVDDMPPSVEPKTEEKVQEQSSNPPRFSLSGFTDFGDESPKPVARQVPASKKMLDEDFGFGSDPDSPVFGKSSGPTKTESSPLDENFADPFSSIGAASAKSGYGGENYSGRYEAPRKKSKSSLFQAIAGFLTPGSKKKNPPPARSKNYSGRALSPVDLGSEFSPKTQKPSLPPISGLGGFDEEDDDDYKPAFSPISLASNDDPFGALNETASAKDPSENIGPVAKRKESLPFAERKESLPLDEQKESLAHSSPPNKSRRVSFSFGIGTPELGHSTRTVLPVPRDSPRSDEENASDTFELASPLPQRKGSLPISELEKKGRDHPYSNKAEELTSSLPDFGSPIQHTTKTPKSELQDADSLMGSPAGMGFEYLLHKTRDSVLSNLTSTRLSLNRPRVPRDYTPVMVNLSTPNVTSLQTKSSRNLSTPNVTSLQTKSSRISKISHRVSASLETHQGEIVLRIDGSWKACYAICSEETFSVYESQKKKELVYYCKIDTLVKVGSCSNLTYQDFVSIKISRPDSSDIVLAVKDRLDALMWISWIVRISKGMDASAQFSIPLYKNGVYMGRVPIGDMMEPSQLDDTQWRMTQSPIF